MQSELAGQEKFLLFQMIMSTCGADEYTHAVWFINQAGGLLYLSQSDDVTLHNKQE